jgi:hypothetical protein
VNLAAEHRVTQATRIERVATQGRFYVALGNAPATHLHQRLDGIRRRLDLPLVLALAQGHFVIGL